MAEKTFSFSCPKWHEQAGCWAMLIFCMCVIFANAFWFTGYAIAHGKCERVKTTCVVSPEGYWRPEWAVNFTESCEHSYTKKNETSCYYDSERLGACPIRFCDLTNFEDTSVLLYMAAFFQAFGCCVFTTACCAANTLENTEDDEPSVPYYF